MPIYGECKKCGGETINYGCFRCINRDLRELASAVIAYDNSIAGHAARGEVKLTETGSAFADTELLDRLYADMVSKAKAV